MHVTAIPAPIALRSGWWRALWATVLSWIVAGLGTAMVGSVLSAAVAWPDPLDRPVGVGWPWRIEGPWSLAADLGPALLFGVLFAWSAISLVYAGNGITPRRLPTALVAAGFVLLSWGGFLQLNVLAIVALAFLLRRESVHPRLRFRRTPLTIGVAAALVAALAAATVSYGRVNALSADWGPVSTSNRGHHYRTVALRGVGSEIVNLESVSVPEHPEVVVRAWSWIGSGVSDIDGLSVVPGESPSLALRLPQDCTAPIRIDRLDVRMKVGDRAHHQVVRVDAEIPCG